MRKNPKIEPMMDMPPVGTISGARSSLTMGGASTSIETTRKRSKLRAADDEERLQFSAGSSIVQLNSTTPIKIRPETTKLSPETAEKLVEAHCSGLHTEELPNSCCSSNGSIEEDDENRIGFLDLEVESAQVETSTCHCSGNQRRDMSLTINKSEEIMESSAEKPKEKNLTTEVNSHRKSSVKKRPSEMELEEFFDAAEKEIQKQFANKYNYDIVNDVPLEGRYEWVKLKP